MSISSLLSNDVILDELKTALGAGGVASVSAGSNILISGTATVPIVAMPVAGTYDAGEVVGQSSGALTWVYPALTHYSASNPADVVCPAGETMTVAQITFDVQVGQKYLVQASLGCFINGTEDRQTVELSCGDDSGLFQFVSPAIDQTVIGLAIGPTFASIGTQYITGISTSGTVLLRCQIGIGNTGLSASPVTVNSSTCTISVLRLA